MPRKRTTRATMKLKLNVKELAESKGLNRSKLALMAGITYETLTLLYRDPYRQIPLIVAVKLARALSVDISALYTIEDE